MKTYKFIIPVFVIAFAFVNFTACQNKQAISKQETTSQQTDVEEPMKVTSAEVHRVAFNKPHKRILDNNEIKSYAEAFLVMITIEEMPEPRGERFNFKIGDYEVKEYGGWENGIYFRIYETDEILELQDQIVQYQYGTGAVYTSDVSLKLPDLKSMKAMEETEILNRK
jgi:hypothetical protein